jgi:hypothetical protein
VIELRNPQPQHLLAPDDFDELQKVVTKYDEGVVPHPRAWALRGNELLHVRALPHFRNDICKLVIPEQRSHPSGAFSVNRLDASTWGMDSEPRAEMRAIFAAWPHVVPYTDWPRPKVPRIALRNSRARPATVGPVRDKTGRLLSRWQTEILSAPLWQ